VKKELDSFKKMQYEVNKVMKNDMKKFDNGAEDLNLVKKLASEVMILKERLNKC
jgi:hypothetical protein